jgi:hypothetical protein
LGVDPNVLQSRLGTRETSTLTLATVAASASLIILQLTVTDKGLSHLWLRLAGCLFALVGFLYREMTIYTADLREEALLRQLQHGLPSNRYWWIRALFVRAFLLSSVGAWIVGLFNAWKPYLNLNSFGVMLIISALFWTAALPAISFIIANKPVYVCLVMIAIVAASIFFMIGLVILSMSWGFGFAGVLYVTVSSTLLTWTEHIGKGSVSVAVQVSS